MPNQTMPQTLLVTDLPDSDLDAALGRIIDGEPLPVDAPMVAAALQGNPQIREQLRRQLEIDSLLAASERVSDDSFIDAVAVRLDAEGSGRAFVDRVRAALPETAKGWRGLVSEQRFFGRLMPVALALVLLGGSITAGSIWAAFQPGQPVLVEVERTEGTSDFFVGERRNLRALVLPEGSVSLRLGSGVLLECEAPLMARFEHPMRLHLSRGRIDVDVGEQGFGFTVVTPAAEVVDLGTKFSVNAAASGEVKVAVFSGQVELRQSRSGTVSLEDGDAVRLTRSGPPERLQSVSIRTAVERGKSRQPAVTSVRDNVATPKLRRFYGVVPGGLREGSRAFCDRGSPRWQAAPGEDFPAELIGADLIQTFQTHRMRPTFQLHVAFACPSAIYVFHDARHSPPEWLVRDFINTGKRLLSTPWPPTAWSESNPPPRTSTIGIPFEVWRRDALRPGSIQFGPPFPQTTSPLAEAAEASPLMYGIAIQPHPDN
jgi:hypothetical protein